MADSYVKTLTLNLRTLFDRKSTGQVEEWIDDIKQSVKDIQWIDDNAFEQVANKIKENFDNLEIVKQGLIQDEDLERVRQAYQEQQENLAKIEILKKEIAEIEMFDKDNELLDELQQKLAELQQKAEQFQQSESNDEDGGNDSFFGSFKESFNELLVQASDMNAAGKNAFNNMQRKIEDFANKAKDAIIDFVNDAIEVMQDMATWDLQNSKVFNQDAVNMYMQTGLQGANAYGMSKALETQGFGSMDDFIEAMPFMNQEQLSYMQEIAEINKKQYAEDLEVALAFQEFQVEYDKFKQELQKSLIDFFMKNKDTIMTILEGIMSFLDAILNVVDGIFRLFSGARERSEEKKKQVTADILGVSSSTLTNNNTTNNTSNVNVNNTFNGVGQQDQSWLANTGQMTYQQVIEALK